MLFGFHWVVFNNDFLLRCANCFFVVKFRKVWLAEQILLIYVDVTLFNAVDGLIRLVF